MEDIVFDLRLALGVLSCAALAAPGIFKFAWKSNSLARHAAPQVCLVVFSILYTLLGLEWICRTQISMSDGWHFTYASKQWHKKYWKPINSFGFRDIEHAENSFTGKKILFVVGDSFVTGHGIADAEHRFANIIARELASAWKVLVVAKNGWNSKQQLQAIQTYPRRPNAILLSYYINDIDEHQATAQTAAWFLRAPEGVTSQFVNGSHLINFLYWRIRRRTLGDGYWEYLQDGYDSPREWSIHVTDLEKIISYADQYNIALSVIVWPHLVRFEESRRLTRKVAALFRQHGIAVLDLAESFTGRHPSQLIVNSLDVHPNTVLHAEVAQMWMNHIGLAYKTDG